MINAFENNMLKKPITLISWNVNGIRAVHRKGFFTPFIEQYQPDILCLQETKAQQGQAEIDLPEYEEYWNSAVKKGYSGTAIFTKTKPLAIFNDFPEDIVRRFALIADSYGDPCSEGRVLTLEYHDFFIVTVYVPNAKSNLGRLALRHAQWDPAFLAYCKQLETKKPVIFCGDLNVAHTPDDLANPKQNEGQAGYTNEERAGFQNFIVAGFVDTFRMFHQGSGQYSWWSHFANSRARNVGWRIDYFLVSQILKPNIQDAFILPEVLGSDHCPVGIVLR